MVRLRFGYGFHHGPHILALLLLLLVVAALVVGILALLRMRRGPGTRGANRDLARPGPRTRPRLDRASPPLRPG